MKILVTGFTPFAGESVNPALEVVKRLPAHLHGAEIDWVEVPTVFQESARIVEEKIADYQPDVVLCIGQAGGRTGLTPERVAINQDDAVIPDNQGQQPIDSPIRADGPAAYFSTLPIKAMVAAIREAGLPATVSNSAGTYVCNHLMYQVLYLADRFHPHVKAGFMHIPYLLEQVVDKPNVAGMGLEDILRGLEAAIGAIVAYADGEDVVLGDGSTH